MKGKSPQKAPAKFKTDLDITLGAYRERELQRWVPDEDTPMVTLELKGGNWDQFKVNQEKFGVELTFDEHLYTTRIDKLAPGYAASAKRAESIAREIENSSLSDRHVLEERGLSVDDLELDEEDKYSGVDRRGDELMAALRGCAPAQVVAPKPGKYATPRQRAAEYHNDPAIVSSSATRKRESPVPEQPAKLELPPKKLPLKKLATPVDKPEESFRLNAQLEINSLREFSANFKIPHKMPNDLLPILSKDKIKQEEILKKQKESPKKGKAAFNPNAAAFTPLFVPVKNTGLQLSPAQQTATPQKLFNRLAAAQPPATRQQRLYQGHQHTNGLGAKRHHQISTAEFFGDALRVPTKESQQQKEREFKQSFSLFFAAKEPSLQSTQTVFERTYQTPPTWELTVDEPFENLFPSLQQLKMGGGPQAPMMPGLPFVPHGVPAPYPNKYPMSPAHQHPQAAVAAAAMAHFQQQQYHAAMIYQQPFPPGTAPLPMYNGEPPYMAPQFMSPPQRFGVQGGSQNNGGVYQGRRYQKNRPNH